MVYVLEGNLKGEIGAVRMVRDGQLVCRFYTYGSQLDTYLDPTHVRKLTEEEQEAGLTGPDKAITQDDMDVALGRPPRRPRGEYNQNRGRDHNQNRGRDRNQDGPGRSDLYSSMKGNQGQRNRREDRMSRGVGERDRFAPTPEQERGDWEEFKDRREADKRVEQFFATPEVKKRRDRDDARRDSADWEIFEGMSGGSDKAKEDTTATRSSGDEDDDFFADLMAELNESLEEDALPQTPNPIERAPLPTHASEDLSKLTVPKLKEILRSKGMKVGGTKKELLERLNQ